MIYDFGLFSCQNYSLILSIPYTLIPPVWFSWLLTICTENGTQDLHYGYIPFLFYYLQKHIVQYLVVVITHYGIDPYIDTIPSWPQKFQQNNNILTAYVAEYINVGPTTYYF